MPRPQYGFEQPVAPPPRRQFNPAFIGVPAVIIAIFLAVWGVFWLFGSSNPETPAGYVGYVTQGSWFGSTKFLGLQTGPTSYGKTWLADVTNVSVTPTTLTETFGDNNEALSQDNLKLTLQVHVLFRIRAGGVKDLVEKYSTLHESKKGDPTEIAFAQFIREPLRTFAREKVNGYKAMEVPAHLTELNSAITDWARKYTAETPFEVLNVVVGNVQPPKVVADAVALKLKADQDLQTENTNIAIAQKRGEARVVEAQALSKATSIIQGQLTPLYIQHEAIEAQKAMAGSPNHSIVYIPVGRNGVPLVSTIGGERGKDVE